MADEIMTIREVAEYLNLAEKIAYRLAAEGKLPGFKVGSRWRFDKAEITRWIEQSSKRKPLSRIYWDMPKAKRI